MVNRTVMICAAAVALASIGAVPGSSIVAHGQTVEGDGTEPSGETVRSVLMNNWNDLIAIHYARQLYKSDLNHFGPYLSALHKRLDWTVNQIDGATAFFRAQADDGSNVTGSEPEPSLCESSGEVTGDDIQDAQVRQSYPTIMCFDDGGVLQVEYLQETQRHLPIQIRKSYAMTPNQPFLVVRYTLSNNLDDKRVSVRFAEVLDVNNKGSLDHEEAAERLVDTSLHMPPRDQQLSDMRAQWRADLNAWIVDMSAANGAFLVLGTFQDMDRHRAFQTVSDQLPFGQAVESELNAFDRQNVPENVEELTSWDVGVSLWKEAVLDPGGEQQYAFFYAVAATLQEAEALVQQARGVASADDWFARTTAAYQQWLQQGRQITMPDPGLTAAYNRALITSKQATQPEFGNWVAATNPAYGFKVWPRDSSVTALGFAATGHLDEAVKYYRWMASVQEDGSKQDYAPGTWFSNYGYWARKFPKRFVEPEWDALGLFMVGVYHTWRLLNEQNPQAAQDFLTAPLERLDQGPASVYEAVTRSAEYIRNNINEHGFGPADHSIWEEDLEFAMFTQVTYASGLNAARLLAQSRGDTANAQGWRDAGKRILDAIHRPDSAQPCPGLWNDAQARWNRGVFPDCKPDSRLDASTDLAWVFGLVEFSDERAESQRQAVLEQLTPGEDDLGIARYEGDEFYHLNPFSPGGTLEASAALTSWPQMDMYMAMLEHWRGEDDNALQRLRWYARVTNVGYVQPGEGVDWQTDRPLPSTAAEPVTAAWYHLGLLNYLDMFDPRLPLFDAAPMTSPELPPQPRPDRSK